MLIKFVKAVAIVLFMIVNAYGQKSKSVESIARNLEKRVDSLQALVSNHNYFYEHRDIELNKFRSRLALEINRNYIFYGNVYELDSDLQPGKSYQRVFRFVAYISEGDFKRRLTSDKSAALKVVRDYCHLITDIIKDGKQEFQDTTSSSFIFYPNRVKIVYLDNSSADETIIEADSHLKSIRVRIDGLMQEIGWE